ncbi:acetate--CoA ligase [Archaeoglobales archaeon ex4484_92]|nr:MAG: acetate--CoA ligase [Archaeoglobales archaeon ex4484_92]
MEVEIRRAELISPKVKELMEFTEKDYEGFWEKMAEEAKGVYWFKKWDKAFEFDEEQKKFSWYIGGKTNICYSCLDYNIEKGNAGRAAFIYESGETSEKRAITYSQLLDLVKNYASALRGLGVEKGQPVAIYMPMGIEAAALMLACARIGAPHVVIFAGFSAKAVADRLEISGARFMFTQDATTRRGIKVDLKKTVDDAIDSSDVVRNNVQNVIVLEKYGFEKTERDLTWDEFLDYGKGKSGKPEKMESNETLFLLPTSGTTAKPKVTVQNHGGYSVYVYTMGKLVYGLKPTDVWFCTSDIGWIVGHSYNVYGPLMHGCTSILYEGTPDYPRTDMWWDIIDRNRVTGFWTSPTGVRMLMKLGIENAKKHDLSSVERVFCAGEPLNPAAWEWMQKEVFEDKVPVIDHMWQTETSGPLIGNPYGVHLLPIKPGSAALPLPGIIADVVNEEGKSVQPGEKGILIVKKPFPGLTPTLWEGHDRYVNTYWNVISGYYYTGDAAYKDEDGYIWFVGRTDEVIKISGHRIGTIEIESSLVSHPAVVEAGVCGVPDELRGEVACAFVVLDPHYKVEDPSKLKDELKAHVRNTLGPIAVIKEIEFVKALPKTRSGKIMRRVMRALWLGASLGDLSTIEDEASVDEIKAAIERMKG